METEKSIREYQTEFEKLYLELRYKLGCKDLDVRISHNYECVTVNFEVRF